jgi:hypothetical protein
MQCSLAVRGLRPSHILGDIDHIQEIDLEFARLIESDRYPPCDPTTENISLIESSDCNSILFSYLPSNQSPRIKRKAEQIIANPPQNDNPKMRKALCSLTNTVKKMTENEKKHEAEKAKGKYHPISAVRAQNALNLMYEIESLEKE